MNADTRSGGFYHTSHGLVSLPRVTPASQEVHLSKFKLFDFNIKESVELVGESQGLRQVKAVLSVN